MLSSQVVFVVTVVLTAASGIAATGIAMFGDTRKNAGQRAVAEKLAQVAVIGAGAIVSLLAVQ